MKNGKNFSVLLNYLTSRWLGFALVGVFAGCLAVVLVLYRLPAEPVAYALLLAVSISALVLAVDYGKYRQRYNVLLRLQTQVNLGVENLPRPTDLVEREYHRLLNLVWSEHQSSLAEREKIQSDLVEYYTLWAHQVKVPIAAMRLLLQTEDAGSLGPELEAELFRIERYADMVLQYLRVESPSSDFVFRHCSLDSIVRQAVRKYAKVFIRRGIALDYQELDCTVLTDEKWLGFVIEQLLDNALKYTSQGKISIYLDREEETLVIQDTGIGIASEDLPRVFDRGYTGSTGRVDRRSTGIGLYLCKRVLDKLSHTIEVESILGVGTKVKLGLNREEVWAE